MINVLAQGHNEVMPVRLEPATPRSPVKHSTTEPLRSLQSLRNDGGLSDTTYMRVVHTIPEWLSLYTDFLLTIFEK